MRKESVLLSAVLFPLVSCSHNCCYFFLVFNFLIPQNQIILKVRCFSVSQNHRRVEVGRDIWKSSGPTPLLKQDHLEPVAQDCQDDF